MGPWRSPDFRWRRPPTIGPARHAQARLLEPQGPSPALHALTSARKAHALPRASRPGRTPPQPRTPNDAPPTLPLTGTLNATLTADIYGTLIGTLATQRPSLSTPVRSLATALVHGDLDAASAAFDVRSASPQLPCLKCGRRPGLPAHHRTINQGRAPKRIDGCRCSIWHMPHHRKELHSGCVGVLVIGAGNLDFRRRLNESEVPLAITS